jgi:hypothetical protein
MTERLAEHIRAGNANKRLVIPACHLRAWSKSGLILSFTSIFDRHLPCGSHRPRDAHGAITREECL